MIKGVHVVDAFPLPREGYFDGTLDKGHVDHLAQEGQ